MVRGASAVHAVERDTATYIAGINISGDAFVGVPEIVDGVVALAGRRGVEMIDDAGAEHAEQGDRDRQRRKRSKDVGSVAFESVAVADRGLHLGGVCSVEMVAARRRIATVQRNGVIGVIAERVLRLKLS